MGAELEDQWEVLDCRGKAELKAASFVPELDDEMSGT